MNCILCGGGNLSIQDTIGRQDLVRLYQKSLQIDVGRIVTSDIAILQCRDCDLIFYDPQVTGDERFYNELQQFDWYYMSEKQEFAWAKSKIPEAAFVLEVGAGRGAFAYHIPGRNYTGLDFSAGAQELAAKNGVSIERCSIEEWADGHPDSYDVVCHFQVLEHVSHPGSFLKACVKALKPGGLLLVCVPAEDSYLSIAANSALNMPPHHISRWTDQALTMVGRLMHCDVLQLDHDSVAPEHRVAMVSEIVRNLWFGKMRPIELGLLARVKIRFVRQVVRLLHLDMLPTAFLGNGTTVKAAFRKHKPL